MVALPLIVHGEALGALSLYADTATIPDAAELRLLTELADDVAFGIAALRSHAERRRVTEELQRERAFLATSIDIIPLPIFYILPSRRVSRMNRAAQQMLGTDDEQQWMAVDLLLAESGRPITYAERPGVRALHGETVVNMELLLRFPDGREVRRWSAPRPSISIANPRRPSLSYRIFPG